MSESPNPPPAQPVIEPEQVGFFREMWLFLRVRKKFWLLPIIIALMMLGLLILFAGSAGVVSPFVYML